MALPNLSPRAPLRQFSIASASNPPHAACPQPEKSPKHHPVKWHNHRAWTGRTPENLPLHGPSPATRAQTLPPAAHAPPATTANATESPPALRQRKVLSVSRCPKTAETFWPVSPALLLLQPTPAPSKSARPAS